ncbi:MAG: RHS repeat-associated core domain-containing protein [Salibacteraceae bacterium]
MGAIKIWGAISTGILMSTLWANTATAQSLCLNSELNAQGQQEINAEKSYSGLTAGQCYALSFEVTSIDPTVDVLVDDGNSLQSISIAQTGYYSFNLQSSGTTVLLMVQSNSGKKQPRAICIDNLHLETVSQQIATVVYKEPVNNYRYAYNGMEKDDEAKGGGNSYTTMFRQHDPRLGRWLSLDPLSAKFPWQSAYVAMDNNPVVFNDPFGLEATGGGSHGKRVDQYQQQGTPINKRHARRQSNGKSFLVWGNPAKPYRFLGRVKRTQGVVWQAGQPTNNTQLYQLTARKKFRFKEHTRLTRTIQSNNGVQVPVYTFDHSPMYKFSTNNFPNRFVFDPSYSYDRASSHGANLRTILFQTTGTFVPTNTTIPYNPNNPNTTLDGQGAWVNPWSLIKQQPPNLQDPRMSSLVSGGYWNTIDRMQRKQLEKETIVIQWQGTYSYRMRRILWFNVRVRKSKRRIWLVPGNANPTPRNIRWRNRN